jgi:hypothetical protein
LTELTKPHDIFSDDNHLIISDGIEGTTIYVYTIDDLSLFSKFRGSADTSGKFIVSGGHEVDIDIRNDTLLISSHWKTSLFTKSGKLIFEKPIDNDTYGYNFLGNQFQGMGYTTDTNNINYYTFNIYDKDFKYIKEITRIKGSTQEGKGTLVLAKKYQALTDKGKFYFKGKSEELEFEVFNSDGLQEKVFNYPYERIAVRDIHKEDIYKGYKEHPFFGQYFEEIKKNLFFPDYLPAIYNFKIYNNHIYALSYQIENTNSILFKFDTDGELLERLEVPMQWIDATETYPFTISNGKLYQLIQNESEKWELQIIKL